MKKLEKIEEIKKDSIYKSEEELDKLADKIQAFYKLKVIVVPLAGDTIAKLNIISANDKILVELTANRHYTGRWQIVGNSDPVGRYYLKELKEIHKETK